MLALVIAFSVQVTAEVSKGSQACFTGFSVTVVDPFTLSCLWEDTLLTTDLCPLLPSRSYTQKTVFRVRWQVS